MVVPLDQAKALERGLEVLLQRIEQEVLSNLGDVTVEIGLPAQVLFASSSR